MAYAATPAAPAEAAPGFEEKAPPTIESHGGKLTPITCFGCGPDGVTSLLMMLAILATLAPRQFSSRGRTINLSGARLVPGLILLAATAWNLIPSLATYVDIHRQAYAIAQGERLWPLAGALALMTLGDWLLPSGEGRRWRNIAGLGFVGVGLIAMTFTPQPMNYGFDVPRDLAFGAGCLIGLPVSLGILWLWRRFNGPLFDVLAIAAGIGGFFLVGALGPWGITQAWMGLEITAFTVAGAAGLTLLGLGSPPWQSLTGRAVWAYSWALRAVFVAMATG
ncbi:MAG: hypothetical protein JWR84_549 [Caulobacter sp.]|nr:hypothetical protein [Caulobacter sp.]